MERFYKQPDHASSILTEAEETGAGYIEGSQVGTGTLTGGSGGNVAGYTLQASNLSSGVNNNISRGVDAYETVNALISGSITASVINASVLYVGGALVQAKSTSFKDGNGTTITLSYFAPTNYD